MTFVLLLAAVLAGRSAGGYFGDGLIMLPDFQLYTQGGLGLFPSPLGRALGFFGPLPFALISIFAAGVCLFAVALAARRAGGSPALAALCFFLSPASLYLAYAGIDSIGLALLLLAFAGVASYWLLPAAALTHLSLLPFTMLRLPRSLAARASLTVVAGCAITSLALTPYAGILTGLFHSGAPEAMASGFLVGILLSLPALFFVGNRLPGPWVVALMIGVLECGLQHHLQARYLLPAAAIINVYVIVPAWLKAMTSRVLPSSALRTSTTSAAPTPRVPLHILDARPTRALESRAPSNVLPLPHNHAMPKIDEAGARTPAPNCSPDAMTARHDSLRF